MGVTSINVRDQGRDFPRNTGASHPFQLRRFREFVIELEDLHFHHDSAVMLPDFNTETPTPDSTIEPRVTALAILAKTLRHAQENATQKLILAGHADTSGDANYNVTLSQLRADNVLAALTGDREGWVKISDQKHKVEDYQLILKWIARDWGFDCDPGPITNTHNTPTRDATKRFQQRYNVEFSKQIAEDGAVGKETWGAFFDVYMVELREVLDVDDDAAVNALRANLKFVDDSKKSVGCGENFPKEARGVDGFRSRENRRVELVFFDPAELPRLECHPAKGKCTASLCEINSPDIFEPTIIPVPPVLPRVARLRVHLQLVYKDPVTSEPDHIFPPDFPVKVEFGDGSAPQNMTIQADGRLNFVTDRRRQSFTLHFDFTPAGPRPGVHYFANATATTVGPGPERIVAETAARAAIDDDYRMFSMPLDWTLSNSDWAVTNAPTFANGSFGASVAEIGTNGTPAKLTLDPHWQHFKFLYFDRKLKQKLSIPPIMVEAFFKLNPPAAAATDTDERIRSNWTTNTEACQCIPWIMRKRPDGSAINNPDTNVALKFRTTARTFIDSSANAVGSRRLITVSSAALPSSGLASDAGLNEGVAPAVAGFNPDIPNVDRLSFYDLPPIWRARTYFAKLSGGTGAPASAQGVYETLANRATTDTTPLLFSLDDIILTNATLAPIAMTANDRVAIFSHKFAKDGDPNLNDIGLFKPDAASPPEPYFSQKVERLNNNVNYIADYPDWTRLVITKGNCFDVFDQRVREGASIGVGARAGVQWVDSASISAPGSNPGRPATTLKPFFAIKPFHEQIHPRFEIGRYDQVCLRCCDVDGTAEIGIMLEYYRFFMRFNTPNGDLTDEQKKPGINVSTQTGTPAQNYINRCCTNIAKRWVGPEGTFNIGRAEIALAEPPAATFRAPVVWFIQHLPNNLAHFQVRVFQNIRASMGANRGSGQFGDGTGSGTLPPTAPPRTDDSISGTFFTAAHETGHGGTLEDEYIEEGIAVGLLAVFTRIPGFDSFFPGAPYYDDNFAMMRTNREIRARYFWHVAEWMRTDVDPSHRRFVVKHGVNTYNIRSHANAPRATHVTQPFDRKTDETSGERGKYDLQLYIMGDDKYTREILPKSGRGTGSSLPANSHFDGMLQAEVRMRFRFRNTSDVNVIAPELTRIMNDIKRRYNNRFVVRGTVRGNTFQNCLLHFSPRFFVRGVSESVDADKHFDVEVKATGSTVWDSVIFGTSRDLIYIMGTFSTFVDAFANMIGIDDAQINTAARYQPLVNKVFPGGNIVAI